MIQEQEKVFSRLTKEFLETVFVHYMILPVKKLRLYCIRYGKELIVLGGGGPKNVKALQDDKKLKKENYFLRWLSKKITECKQNNDIPFSNDFMDFKGDLIIKDDYEN